MGACVFGLVAESPGDEVLEVGPLAVDGVDPRSVERVDDEAQPGPCLNGLELVEVADAQHLGAGALGHLEHGAHLAHREHAGLVDDDDGGAVEGDAATARVAKEPREGVGLDIAFGAEIDRRAPRDRGGDDAVAALAIEIRDGAKGRGFPRPGRAQAHRERGVSTCEMVDRTPLLFADREALPDEFVEPAIDRIGVDRVAGALP